jgi:hypothetical protein
MLGSKTPIPQCHRSNSTIPNLELSVKLPCISTKLAVSMSSEVEISTLLSRVRLARVISMRLERASSFERTRSQPDPSSNQIMLQHEHSNARNVLNNPELIMLSARVRICGIVKPKRRYKIPRSNHGSSSCLLQNLLLAQGKAIHCSLEYLVTSTFNFFTVHHVHADCPRTYRNREAPNKDTCTRP